VVLCQWAAIPRLRAETFAVGVVREPKSAFGVPRLELNRPPIDLAEARKAVAELARRRPCSRRPNAEDPDPVGLRRRLRLPRRA
jgi:hypothetical protein